MEKRTVDYLIVGQGLAGSAVAMQLMKLGKKIMVIDQPSKNNSSRVAAGLVNPITGKKSTKTWLADELFPYLNKFYGEIEKLTGKRFFFPMPVYKAFSSPQEQNEWMGKSADEVYQPYIEAIHTSSYFGEQVNDKFGGLMLKQCGYLNTNIYLDAVRIYLEATESFLDEHFDESQIKTEGEFVEYRHIKASRIILCQGSSATFKGFQKSPVRPLKGEIITIKTDWEKHVILNRGVYIVPGSVDGQFRIGSTYNFADSSPGITIEGRAELEQKLKELITMPYEVLGQEWGLRPTTPDRRPILGKQKECERLIIFNGLGTKGVSLAPYFSEVLIQWLENAISLNKDVALTRYK